MLMENKSLFLENIYLTNELSSLLKSARSVSVVFDLKKLEDLSAPLKNQFFDVAYTLPDGKVVKEVYVTNVKNGVVANYYEDYMRRRDPDTMLIGDDLPTDKPTYKDVFKKDFSTLRKETLDWIKDQELIVVPFIAGNDEYGVKSIAIIPKNAAFFGFGLALLQGIENPNNSIGGFDPKCFVFIAPPFRHTHFSGKQVVVHARSKENYEIFSYNLYPGPSAKKGIYGVLLHFGEMEGWVTNHCAVVKVTTPYGNKINIMHEGASGGGKSEINQHIQREIDGSVVLGKNIVTKETQYFVLPKSCNISPVVDDMGSCYPQIQNGKGKLGVVDAENGWFIRVDHITNYGIDPDIESTTIHPKTPLFFLNISAPPGGTALLWDHIIDLNGKPCPNPRVVVPKTNVANVFSKPVYVDIRSFGIRTPPFTKENPTYGVIGLVQILPPSIAWLWRIVAPRGHANPSIVSMEGMHSEGVGSYWPFATGKKVTHANLLLKQILEAPDVHYVLCPVKHVGAWQVGFTPEWIMREYFSRRGGVKFNPEEICFLGSTILGYSLNSLVMEGQTINESLLKVELQPEVRKKGFKEGSKILTDYFKKELEQFLVPEIDPLGRKIIEAFLADATIEEMENLIKGKSILIEE